MLKECSQLLWDAYDLALLDLDGVVYIGPDAVPGVPERLEEAVRAGLRLAFVTNNASRPPREVAKHLTSLGVPAGEDEVVTSAQAAARLLAERLDAGAPVFVIGGPGLFEALEEEGLRPVQSLDDDPVAVVSGYYADLVWRTVSEGAILVREGLPWIASNTDMTVPTARGKGPGNGVLVDLVARFASREPEVAGKPRRPLFEEAIRRLSASRSLVVGDRLDTDIEGAVNAGLDSLLVLTGVTGLEELVRAEPGQRPSYISSGLAGLGQPHPSPVERSSGFELEGWRAVVRSGRLEVDGDGSADAWWRVVAAAAWHHLDAEGTCVETSGLDAPR